MAEKRIRDKWVIWGRLNGFGLGIVISGHFINIDFFFWYFGMEF